MATEGLNFPEAVEKLALDAGLEMPRDTPAERAKSKKQSSLYEAMELACKFFERSLLDQHGDIARHYIEGRGLDLQAISRFRLGYAPRGDTMLSSMKRLGISETLLKECGLLEFQIKEMEPMPFFATESFFR